MEGKHVLDQKGKESAELLGLCYKRGKKVDSSFKINLEIENFYVVIFA